MIEPVEQAEASARPDARIIQGDCVEEMRAMPENSVDSVVCDPPYDLTSNKKGGSGVASVNLDSPYGRARVTTGNGSGGFMGKAWDSTGVAFKPETWEAALRVLKPGGYLLAFGGTRTVHRLACAIEDAGFEIRDRLLHIGGDAVESIPGEIAWVYGSGFPKSANIEKLMTKAQGQKRRAHGMVPLENPQSARMHSGIGSAVKPSYEPIVCARKPLSEKNLIQNILKHGEWLEDGTVYKVGTGGLNIDASRIGTSENISNHSRSSDAAVSKGKYGDSAAQETHQTEGQKLGRFPSNTLWSHVPGPNGCVRVGSRRVKGSAGKPDSTPYNGANGFGPADSDGWKGNWHKHGPSYADPDGLEEVAAFECVESCPVKALDEQSGVSKSTTGGKPTPKKNGHIFAQDEYTQEKMRRSMVGHSDSGGASRFFQQFHEAELDPNPGFFYSPKASRAERNRGLEGVPEKVRHTLTGDTRPSREHGKRMNEHTPPKAQSNSHPCVKPLSLMRYLLRLVTPENGTCLDPFAGSGSTGVAALSEGFNAILIEAEPEYAEIAQRRCAHALLPEAEQAKAPKPAKARNTYGFKTTDVLRRCPEHNESIPSGSTTYKCGCAKVWYKVEPEPVELEEFSGRLPF